MVSVASLLNPAVEDHRSLPSPTCSSAGCTPEPSSAPSTPPSKKLKLAKDAAIFTRGKVQGFIRYPPCEQYDTGTVNELRTFSVHPLGEIADYRRHIPYNSDKKGFLAKTGRGAFEVFQYTFKMPGKDREYNVMWDYNVGLVRITPFFKCQDFGKTAPAKMLGNNPGLREITHSITGGALAAQGYWMPFEAAKAVAATFCYDIRYVLVPLFGRDFPSACIKEGDEGWQSMIIDPKIVERCTQEANHYKDLAVSDRFDLSRSGTPDSRPPTSSPWPELSKPTKLPKIISQRGVVKNSHSQKLGRNQDYLPSPQSSTDMPTPRVSKPWPTVLEFPAVERLSEGPRRYDTPTSSSDVPADTSGSESEVSPKTVVRKRKGGRIFKDKAKGGKSSKHYPHDDLSSEVRSPSPIHPKEEIMAACALMQLRYGM